MQSDPIITSDDILGRDAVDPEGEFLGIVMKLHVDRSQKTLVGITIDQGFMKPDLFIGIDYIEKFGVDAVFLNRIPFEKYIGLMVYASDGRVVGTVEKVRADGGSIQTIEVRWKRGEAETSSEIPARAIEEIGTSVILKKGFYTKKIESD